MPDSLTERAERAERAEEEARVAQKYRRGIESIITRYENLDDTADDIIEIGGECDWIRIHRHPASSPYAVGRPAPLDFSYFSFVGGLTEYRAEPLRIVSFDEIYDSIFRHGTFDDIWRLLEG